MPSRLARDAHRLLTTTSAAPKPPPEDVELRHDFGGWVFEMWGFQEAHGYFRYRFAMTFLNGDVIAGTDFGQIADDGRICRLVVLPD